MKPFHFLQLLFGLPLILVLLPMNALADEVMWERLNREAMQLQANGEFDAAVMKAKEALTVAQREFGDDQMKVAIAWRRLASAYAAAGQVEAAETALREAVGIWNATLGSEHASTIAQQHLYLAQSLEGREEFTSALNELDEALKLQQKYFGTDHSTVAATLEMKAAILQDLEGVEAVLPLLEQVAEIREKSLGNFDARTVRAYSKYAWALSSAGKVEEALPLHLKALQLARNVYGDEDPRVAVYWIATAQAHAGVYQAYEQEIAYKNAVEIFAKAGRPQEFSDNEIVALRGLSEIYVKAGRQKDAEDIKVQIAAWEERRKESETKSTNDSGEKQS